MFKLVLRHFLSLLQVYCFGLGYFWGLMLIYLIFGRVFKLGCGPKSFAECYPFLWVSKNSVCGLRPSFIVRSLGLF